MKALTLKDILPKIENPLTKLSVFYEGQWTFATLQNPTSTTESQEYYLISYEFGLVPKNESLPSKFALRGKAGSYAIKASDGTLSTVTDEQYQRAFPSVLLDRPAPPITSALLTDPKYLTDTVRKTKNEDSDSIQVGQSTFKNTDPTKTILILPSGKQVAVLRDDPVDPFQNITTEEEPEDEEPPPPLPGY